MSEVQKPKKKLGRPKSKPEDVRSEQVRITASVKEKEMWHKKAANAGYRSNLSGWFRSLAKQAR